MVIIFGMEKTMDLESSAIARIQEKRLSQASFSTLSKFYSLFADPTRLQLIYLLSANELCVNDIALIRKRSQSRVSHQLAILRKRDIVKHYRKGKRVLYTLTDNHIKDLIKTGLEHVSEKDSELYQDRKRVE